MDTPLLLIHFNRPDLTKLQLAQLAQVRPSKVWVLSDGPRAGHPSDEDRVAEVRAVIDAFPWEVQPVKIYRAENWGLSGILRMGSLNL